LMCNKQPPGLDARMHLWFETAIFFLTAILNCVDSDAC
jgi:hypothetical protein